VVCALFFKEFAVICFDAEYSRSQGWPTGRLDLIMMAFVTAVTVIGLQAVGLILVVALLIIPPAAARFWTERLRSMFVLSAIIGAVSGIIGAAISALVPKMPAGALVVVTAAAVFLVSMFVGPSRGILVRALQRWDLSRRVGQQHVLRAIYEMIEEAPAAESMPLAQRTVTFEALRKSRSWSGGELSRLLRRLERDGLAIELPRGTIRLSEDGIAEAARVTRNHRLWEIYLITHADIAPSHVDRDADMIEHVLGKAMVSKLEAILEQGEAATISVPSSPHVIG
jgi:manganese/zinc/iron transport system permease protein